MFEQSVLPDARTKRSYTFAAVTTAEIVIICGAIIIPLFFVPVLTPPKLPVVLRFARAVHLVNAEPEQSKARPLPSRRVFVPRAFYAPSRIPTQTPNIQDIVQADAPDVSFSAVTGSDLGVPGALDATGAIPTPAPPENARPKPATPPAPIHVSSGVQEAKLINRVVPVYPRLAVQTRQFGKVRLVATVGKDGRIKQVQVLSGPAFLVEAAVEAVKQWVYRPTLLNGQAVEVIAPIEVNFVLNE